MILFSFHSSFPPLFYSVLFPSFFSILLIGLAVRVFAIGPGDRGSIPGRVIPKTQKRVLDASLLNTQHYKVRIKGKVKQSREGVAPSPTPWCSSYRKGSLRVTLDYVRQLYLLTYLHLIPSFLPFLLFPFFTSNFPPFIIFLISQSVYYLLLYFFLHLLIFFFYSFF